ncbi:flagellar biosynthesis protein FlhB [Cognatilysobacter bugurensis]|uniref:Flagellar biosynthetic protein FlhB n=1 Tax=Cognatilysobacter bugurensis TaxID=543356 RepID=A0A918T690_9GAMM|nr:flagellar biosynthesis protein FlhB [Lysobacter bugurensis]GHA90263.1 flagellar biosynthesis protein FlhB [Lysobacter bugurensis]
MSESDQEDKTEQPSEKRLRDARAKGDVPQSRELANVAVLGCATVALMVTGPGIGSASQGWMRDALRFDPTLIGEPDRLLGHAATLMLKLMLPMLPLVLAALAACLIAPAIMGGLRFSNQALQPDLKRLSPMAGLKRMYGKESLAELVRSLLRVVLLGGIGAFVVYRAFDRLIAMPKQSLESSIAYGVDLAVFALLAMVGALGVLAALDIPYQHWHWRNKLKMTKQELRDEHKELEGNPEVKARVRQVAREMSQRRMMDAVPTADVVITNPTHYAVALKYEAGAMRAPKVVAMGVDELALRIRELAGHHKVTLVEAPPLARALYRQAKVDQEIPVKLYAAVAQVLSYVYQLKRWHPARGPMPELNQLDVGRDGAPDSEAPR